MRIGDRAVRDAIRASGPSGVAMVVVALVDAAVVLLVPITIARAVDTVVGADHDPVVLVLAVTLLAAATLNEAVREIVETRSRTRGALGLRRELLRRVMQPRRAETPRLRAGDMLSRILRSTADTAGAVTALAGLAARLLTSIGGLIALFLIDVRLGLFVVAGAPLMFAMTRWLISRVGFASLDYQRAQGDLSARFVDALAGIRTIRACGTADREVGRILRPLSDLHSAGHAFWRVQAKAMWRMDLFVPILQCGVLVIAGFGVLAGRVSPGELLAAGAYTGLATAVVRDNALFGRYARAAGAARQVSEVLATPDAAPGRRMLPAGAGELRLRGVRVEEAGIPVLDGLDLDVAAGTTLAVVGSSGAGKSTLMAVVGGLRVPDSGQVLLDGVPVTELADRSRAVSYAFERPRLRGDTIADAIGDADEPPTLERLRMALRVASAVDFVDRLPQGIHTPLRDLMVSGGEMQRLGLARAVWRQSRMMIFDDAMSSVDTVTEAQIGAALTHSRPGTTKLIVTHRPSTAARADLVAWLHGGVIRALAPHDMLAGDADYLAVFRPADDPVEQQC